jgi:DNA helicase-2/ATP-dependent DNA helicase PcrA
VVTSFFDADPLFAAAAPTTDAPAPGRTAAGMADEVAARRAERKAAHQKRVAALLEGLNPPQKQAVLHEGGPVLVVAGAGSGKTRVLTRRIAYLVAERNVHPGSVLAITFTNKAAAEMRERVSALVGNRAKLMWVSTFHSACVRILRSEIARFGIARTFSIYDDTDAKRLMALVCRDLELDPKKFPPRAILNWVSNQKNELVDAESAGKAVAAADPASVSANPQANATELIYAEAYRTYQARLAAANALDFDDLIMTTVHLLQAFPDLRETYRRRFRHVLVDEYQDTNHAQYMLIKELCGEHPTGEGDGPEASAPELMVVGDSDQSIYAFRGATIRNILAFENDFPGASTILLEQNYRSTQTILDAANGVISRNEGRAAKNLWSDAGAGELITGYVADSEHDEATFVAAEIDARSDAGEPYAHTAVFYRTNAQSRVFEEVFVRVGLPYKVVGGVRFYERREIRDAVAYLRAVANRADDVSTRRILNVPKRGIGDRAEAAVEALAARERISFGEALRRVDEVPGLATRSAKQIAGFNAFMAHAERLVAEGAAADQVLATILQESGYLTELQESSDPQDETRLENLVELVAVAREFVAGGGAQLLDPVPTVEGADETGEVLEGAPEPDVSLSAFLERVSLVADSDQIPDQDGEKGGVVTLMTLHTAKGLEFDTVFLTGLEDGVFPHQRALNDRKELEEERRLAYVGVTRARKRLYLSRAVVRAAWGAPQHNPPSRFLGEIPDRLIDWRRLESAQTSWRSTSATSGYGQGGYGAREGGSNQSWRNSVGYGAMPTLPKRSERNVPTLAAGDKVLHGTFGLGTVVATSGTPDLPKADVDFGSVGVKRLSLKHAPLEKV